MRPFLSLLMLLTLAACTTGPAPSGSHFKQMAGYGMAKTRPDPLARRRIVLLDPYNGDHLDINYYHDGHYDNQALKKINWLFRDRHANVVGKIDPELIDYLVDIRTRLDLPDTVTFEILSGYRTRRTNQRMAFTNGNVAKESLHMRGWAVDFRIPYVSGQLIAEIAKTMQRGGVAYYPADNHVHIDIGNIRTWRTPK